VNVLLYSVLILVFYMLARFYLEEDIHDAAHPEYSRVSTEDLDEVEEPQNAMYPMEVDASAGKETHNSGSSAAKKPVTKSAGFGVLSVLDISEPEGTKQEVIQRVVICSAGLHISFCIWGLLQERMLTFSYDGDFFRYSFGLVFITRVGGLALSAFLMYYKQVEWVPTPLYEYAFPSVANILSSWCQYEALRYVTFPTQMLAKAFKLVPVMLMGKALHNKSYESYEYVVAATIGFGIYVFLESSEKIRFGEDSFGNVEQGGAAVGVVLLLLFLFFDSFTAQWQTRMFELQRNMSPLQMMFVINAFSAVFSCVTLLHQEELFATFDFLYRHPVMLLHMTMFFIFATVGQLYIFYTVKQFGAVVFSIIMSLRILLSIVLSCLVYRHPINELGGLGIIIVFGAIAYRTKRKTEGKPLIRWKEATHETKLVFNEWHEHVDI
jgi:adenosine 3'-phospho 5'-phosphosulfate transporter B2